MRIIQNIKRVGGLFLTLILCSGFLTTLVSAAESPLLDVERKGSITVNICGVELDANTGSYTKEHPLTGVDVTLYRLGDIAVENSTVAYHLADKFIDSGIALIGLDSADTSNAVSKQLKVYVQQNKIEGAASSLSDVDGNVLFSNLSIGLYMVSVDVSTNHTVYSEIDPFLVALPITNASGTAWEYDIVAKPKTEAVYGGVILEKVNESKEYLKGAAFQLERKNEDSSWVTYKEGLVTNQNGQVAVDSLPCGTYRFREIKAPSGYKLSLEVKEFSIAACGTIHMNAAGRYVKQSGEITVITYINYKVIEKQTDTTPGTSPKDKPNKASGVKTADSTNSGILLCLLIGALVTMSILLKDKNKVKKL